MGKNIQKILALLAKDSLNREDKDQLDSILSSDQEAKEFFSSYKRIENIIKTSSHLTEQELADYIFFRNRNSENSFASSRIKFIEEHIGKCTKCSSVFSGLSEEYSAISEFIKSNLNRSEVTIQPLPGARFSFFQNKLFGYSFAAVTAAVILFFSLAIISQLVTPVNIKLAMTGDNSLSYVTRGRASNEFQEGIVALGDKKYDEAINYFESDIKTNKNDETIFYSHYILGLTYLEVSENDFLGLFPSFNKSSVNKAADNFKKCIAKNNSGNFPDITSNSYFFLAKTELMLGKTEQAKKSLEMVIKIKGSKIDQAKELLNKLE